jgi:hypothetical protein
VPTINIEGKGPINFPDEMSPEEIQAAIERRIAPAGPDAQADSPAAGEVAGYPVEASDAVPSGEGFTAAPEPGASEPQGGLPVAQSPGAGGGLPFPKPAGEIGAAEATGTEPIWPASGNRVASATPLSGEMAAAGSGAEVFQPDGPPVGISINAYLTQRVQDQIDWYERRSASAQAWFKRLRSLEIVAAAAIPLLSGYTAQWPPAGVIVGVLGVLVAALAGLLGLHQHQERWRSYRVTAEALKREKFLFLARAAPYDGAGAFPRLVQTVEALLADESARWTVYTTSSGQTSQPAGPPSLPISESPVPDKYSGPLGDGLLYGESADANVRRLK